VVKDLVDTVVMAFVEAVVEDVAIEFAGGLLKTLSELISKSSLEL
jgi:hypothetical protein